MDVGVGKALGALSGELAKNIKVKTPYIKQVDKVIDRQKRLTKNSKQSNPSRVKAKEKILKEVVEHKASEIAKTSARVGSISSGASAAIGNKIVDNDDNNK